MLLITCPYCGERPEIEFSYAGQAHLVRPKNQDALTDSQWTEYLVMRDNPKGPHAERWRHVHGCARFFNAVRDTTSDEILVTYEAGAPRPDLRDKPRRAA